MKNLINLIVIMAITAVLFSPTVHAVDITSYIINPGFEDPCIAYGTFLPSADITGWWEWQGRSVDSLIGQHDSVGLVYPDGADPPALETLGDRARTGVGMGDLELMKMERDVRRLRAIATAMLVALLLTGLVTPAEATIVKSLAARRQEFNVDESELEALEWETEDYLGPPPVTGDALGTDPLRLGVEEDE